jgi:hypothetical protein
MMNTDSQPYFRCIYRSFIITIFSAYWKSWLVFLLAHREILAGIRDRLTPWLLLYLNNPEGGKPYEGRQQFRRAGSKYNLFLQSGTFMHSENPQIDPDFLRP